MPDSKIEDLTALTEETYTDTYLIQRRINGVWTDLKTTPYYIYGIPVRTLDVTFEVTDDGADFEQILAAPGSGNIIVPIWSTVSGSATSDLGAGDNNNILLSTDPYVNCHTAFQVFHGLPNQPLSIGAAGLGTYILPNAPLYASTPGTFIGSTWTVHLRMSYIITSFLPPG